MQLPEQWREGFEPIGEHSVKVRCVVCGRTGYPGVLGPRPWQIPCIVSGHPYECKQCPQVFSSVQGVTNHTRIKHG